MEREVLVRAPLFLLMLEVVVTASRCQPQSGISKCFLVELRRSAVATKDTGYYCARILWW